MSYIVALTGGIGSGKSTVSDKFASLGVPIVDADIISRQIVMLNTYAFNMIKQHFGSTILNNDGSLNRAKLRKKIFNDPREKNWLNNLLHPLIHQETQRQLTLLNFPYVVWVVPLLIENNLEHLANRVLVIDVTPEEQIARIMKRDKISQQEAKNILSNQVSRTRRLEKADDIINNHHNNLTLDETLAKLHQKYIQLGMNASQETHNK
ncbi:Dephospho-CoA kinase [Arsenophonus endosymbiont of Aleurodicus floccissimus]|uniref:dephospho-CoA kinase n=1 Tax=Arsenophonus endosymbiont of Aleurodicus floccissimus TaxID=2152761 RepID=UPI000E6B0575|nr:dephospho-CoA kinase [Arsenophonus endosymbiont of Aleurodicus floccissimus]SPP32682.1 Dephospho-CoA kinase [Arsenophonus endosymbiont of Aleurodicus floccissimus]